MKWQNEQTPSIYEVDSHVHAFQCWWQSFAGCWFTSALQCHIRHTPLTDIHLPWETEDSIAGWESESSWDTWKKPIWGISPPYLEHRALKITDMIGEAWEWEQIYGTMKLRQELVMLAWEMCCNSSWQWRDDLELANIKIKKDEGTKLKDREKKNLERQERSCRLRCRPLS